MELFSRYQNTSVSNASNVFCYPSETLLKPMTSNDFTPDSQLSVESGITQNIYNTNGLNDSFIWKWHFSKHFIILMGFDGFWENDWFYKFLERFYQDPRSRYDFYKNHYKNFIEIILSEKILTPCPRGNLRHTPGRGGPACSSTRRTALRKPRHRESPPWVVGDVGYLGPIL